MLLLNKETKKQRNKETKKQRNKETKKQRNKEKTNKEIGILCDGEDITYGNDTKRSGESCHAKSSQKG